MKSSAKQLVGLPKFTYMVILTWKKLIIDLIMLSKQIFYTGIMAVSWELMSTIMNVVIIIGILIGIATSTKETSGEFAVAILLLSAVGE